jgi:uncharacterized protein YbjT (DUF2867 family)
VIRPSLVYGQKGEATALFKQLAALPIVPLPAGGEFSFRPILVEDLAGLVLEALSAVPPIQGIVQVGGSQELTLREIVFAIRTAQRGPEAGRGPSLGIPKFLMKPAAWFGDLTGAGPLTSDMLEMLVTSDAPDVTAMNRVFTFKPRGLLDYLGNQ